MGGTTRTGLLLALLAALAVLGGGWMLRDHWLPAGWHAVQGLARTAPEATSARKCVSPQGAVLYSSDACPTGTREQALVGGTVSVLAAPPAVPASKASAQPLLRQLDDAAETERQRERRLDKALGS